MGDAAQIWTALLAACAWGLGAVLHRRSWLPAVAAVALCFQLVTLTQPSALVGALLVAVVAGLLLRGAGREPWPRIASSQRLD